jgi:predicted nucleotidyltransferase
MQSAVLSPSGSLFLNVWKLCFSRLEFALLICGVILASPRPKRGRCALATSDVRSAEKLKRILDELKQEFLNIYGTRLESLILYGSYARGDAGLGSDIDVLVVLAGSVDAGDEIRRTGEMVAGLSLKYDVTISRFFVSAKQFDENWSLLRNVRREGIILYDAGAVSIIEEGH